MPVYPAPAPLVLPAVVAPVVSAARLGPTQILPVTGIAAGIWVLIALGLILGGLVARWKASRPARRSG